MINIKKLKELALEADALQADAGIAAEDAVMKAMHDWLPADTVLELIALVERQEAELERRQRARFILSQAVHNMVVANQASWIEWKHGSGAEAAMSWIENGLAGPGHIPTGTEAQAYFDANYDDRMEPDGGISATTQQAQPALTDAQIIAACEGIYLSDHTGPRGSQSYDVAIARAILAVAPSQCAALDERAEILQEICDMQKQNYGDGIATHLALIELCDKARASLAAQSAKAESPKKKRPDLTGATAFSNDGQEPDWKAHEAAELAAQAPAQPVAAQGELVESIEGFNVDDGEDHSHPKYGRGIFFTYNCMQTFYTAPLPAPVAAPAVAEGWQPIGTAPRGAKGFAWMLLAWGPKEDQSIGKGMRIGEKFYATGVFHCLGQKKQFEMREIEVTPTHWMPLPSAPVGGGHE